MNTDNEFNIHRFCADHSDHREFLHRPFNNGDYTYASNGHFAIRVPIRSQYGPAREHIVQTMESAFGAIENREFLAVPAFDWPEKPSCVDCEGTGKAIKSTCTECNGEGTVSFSNDCNSYHNECITCDGEGQVKPDGDETCDSCCGKGKTYGDRFPFDLPDIGVRVNLIYLDRFLKLPGVQVSGNPESHQMCFRFDGGYGVLMSCR